MYYVFSLQGKKNYNLQNRFSYSNVSFWFTLVFLLSLKAHKINFTTVCFHIFNVLVKKNYIY